MSLFYSLDETHLKLLRFIYESRKASIAQLSAKFFLTPDAIRRRLKLLEKHGFVYICDIFSSAHYYSISPDFNMSLIEDSNSTDNFKTYNFLGQLTFLQLLVLLTVALLESASSTYVAQATGFNESSVRSALGRFLEKDIVYRQLRGDRYNSYIYLLGEVISKQNLVDFVLDSQVQEKVLNTFSQNGFVFSVIEQTLYEKTEMQDQNAEEQQNGATIQNELNYPNSLGLENENEESFSDVDRFIEKLEDLKKLRNKLRKLEQEISAMGNKAENYISPLWSANAEKE